MNWKWLGQPRGLPVSGIWAPPYYFNHFRTSRLESRSVIHRGSYSGPRRAASLPASLLFPILSPRRQDLLCLLAPSSSPPAPAPPPERPRLSPPPRPRPPPPTARPSPPPACAASLLASLAARPPRPRRSPSSPLRRPPPPSSGRLLV